MGGCSSRDKPRNDIEAVLEDEMEIILMMNEEKEEENDDDIRYGKGNAIAGFKAKYNLYPPSDVVERVMCIHVLLNLYNC